MADLHRGLPPRPMLYLRVSVNGSNNHSAVLVPDPMAPALPHAVDAPGSGAVPTPTPATPLALTWIRCCWRLRPPHARGISVEDPDCSSWSLGISILGADSD